jgi:hypothetical protein
MFIRRTKRDTKKSYISASAPDPQTNRNGTSLQVIAFTEYNEIFSGRQPRQEVKVFRSFGNQHRPHLQDDTCGSVTPKLMTVVLPNYQQNPEEGDGFSTRNIEELSQLDASVCPRKCH